MPEVPELNLPKFKPAPYTKEERFESRFWRYKKKEVIKGPRKKHKKARIKDKALFNTLHDQDKHLREII